MQKKRTTHAGGAQKNRLVEDKIHLKKGKYIVGYRTDDSHNFGDWNDRAPENPEYWGISLYAGDEDDKKYISHFDPYKIENIIVRIVRVRDNENESYPNRV